MKDHNQDDFEGFGSTFSDAQPDSSTSPTSNKFLFPEFSVDPDKVTVLFTPTEFHQCLIDLYRSARQRAVLAALYIGTAEPEQQVIDAILESCQRVLQGSLHSSTTASSSDNDDEIDSHKSSRQGSRSSARSTGKGTDSTDSTISTRPSISGEDEPKLVVDILIDAARGTRLEKNSSSLTMLESLFELKESLDSEKHPSEHSRSFLKSSSVLKSSSQRQSPIATSSPLAINVNLFHSPLLSGLLYQVLPPRVNEILGVFHTKVFLVDNTVVLTGANLSESYLTNRQDRYVVIKDAPDLADFLHQLVQLIQRFSFSAEPESQVSPPTKHHHHHHVSKSQSSQERHRSSISRHQQQPQRNDRRVISLNNGKSVVLSLKGSVPDPTTSPAEFKEKLGQALSNFVAQQCSSTLSLSPRSSTTLHVAIQAGFCSPRIQQEEELLSAILSSDESEDGLDKAQATSGPSSSSLLTPFGWCPTRKRPCSLQQRIVAESRRTGDSRTSQIEAISRTSHTPLCTPSSSPGSILLNRPVGPIVLASGYLNMTDKLLQQLTRATASNNESLQVYMAAPEANSFHQSQGLSQYIPMAYSYVGGTQLLMIRELWKERRRERIQRQLVLQPQPASTSSNSVWGLLRSSVFGFSDSGQHTSEESLLRPTFWEYDRPSWTFHSKGIWFYPKQSDRNAEETEQKQKVCLIKQNGKEQQEQMQQVYPIGTVLGSSNFGLRTRDRDLDVLFFIQTRDRRLQQQLHQEVEIMRQYSREVADVSALVSRCPRWLRFLLRWSGLKTLL